VVAQGVSHVTTQLVILREMLVVLSGNELVIGVLLGSWLLLTGLGARVGRWGAARGEPLTQLVWAQFGVAVLPLGTVVALRTLRNTVFVRGAEIGLSETVMSSLALLLPYCLLTGYSLTLAATALGRWRPEPGSIARLYVADGLGDVLGGALFALWLTRLSDHFVTLFAVGVLNLGAAALLGRALGRPRLAVMALVLAVGLGLGGSTVNLDRPTLGLLYPGRRIVEHVTSPYGDLVVTQSANQYDLLQNGVSLGAAEDVEHAEEIAHFALAQRPRAERVLLLGGAASGVAAEVLRYPVRAVDCAEVDPRVIALVERYATGQHDPRLHWVERDGRAFVRQTDQRYDVVILDLPDPTTLQHNRFYTREFFVEVKRILRPRGVLSLSVGQYADYVSPELGRVLSIARQTLGGAFAEVRLVPAGRVGLLASDGELTLDIAERLETQGIRARWLSRPVLAAMLLPDRVAELDRSARAPAPLNRDASPALQTAALRRWLGRFELGFLPWAAAGTLGLVVAGLALGRVPLAVATIGFSASALEVLLLLGLAVAHGAVYGTASLVVTAYMLGSTVGAWGAGRLAPSVARKNLGRVGIGSAALAAICPLLLAWSSTPGAGEWAWAVVFPALAVVLGLLTGAAFPLGARADYRGVGPTAARLYGADLAGASLGAVLMATVMVPWLGVGGASALVAGLCLVGVAGLLSAGSTRSGSARSGSIR
jgi:spermidine synthase